MRTRSFAFAVVLACGGDDPPTKQGLTCEEEFHPRCSHPIDRLLIPRLRAAEIPIVDADPDELARRTYLDLVDRVPTPDERAELGRDGYEPFVDRLFADPAHEALQRARWNELFGVDFAKISTLDTIDLDARVGELERGASSYTQFANAIATHPGFYALHPANDWIAALYPAFLGRPARQDEIAGFAPLSRIWQPRFYIEGGIWFKNYRAGLDSGATDNEAIVFANTFTFGRAEYSINTCMCAASEGVTGCATQALGQQVDIGARCIDLANPFAAVNLQRPVAYSPGERDDCFGGGNRPECADRETDFAGGFFTLAPIPAISDVTTADLAEIGEAFAARGDFWEAAADRELRNLLDWWQSTFRQPESDLPEVRALLAAELRGGKSPREVRRLIVTSLLYRLPAVPPPSVDVARETEPWLTGPTKLLAGEGWLRSAALVVGETASFCDHRFVQRGGVDFSVIDDRYSRYETSSLDTLFANPTFSLTANIALGGCNADDLRPTRSNIGLAFSQSDLARRLCAYGRGVLPAAWNGDLDVAADHLSSHVLARSLDPTERTELVDEMEACLVAGSCQSAEHSARWLCLRMLDSAEFATY